MPTKPLKSCPDGKERNPITKRCVRKCKSNRVRDIKTFKCIKDPLNHVVNPITERYVKSAYLKNIEKKQQRILQTIRKTHKSPLQKSPSLKVSSHKSPSHKVSSHKSSSRKTLISNSSSRLASPATSIRQSLSSLKLSSSKSSGIKKGSINSSNSSKKLSRTPSYQSSSRVFSDDVLKTNKVKKIQNFLRDKLTTNKNTLINRINRYNLLKPKLSLLKDDDCLEVKIFNGNTQGQVTLGYTIRNIINLEKLIGSKSKYGTIYLTSIPNLLGIYPIATKVMKFDSDNVREVDIMTFITNKIILKKLSRHFLMIYSSSNCVKKTKKIPLKIRLISVNELADGDLKMLVTKRDVLEDDELMFNLLFQTYISVATFQNLVKFVHKDAHHGNFLYQKNNEIGYYHYTFNGKDYYLKSCKYNIIIFDYGFAERIEEQDIDTINADYFQIIHAFMNKKTGWGNYKDLPKDNTNKTIIEISTKIFEMSKKTYQPPSRRTPLQRTLFIDIIENIFLKYTPKDMFITQRPANILNEIPFRIE
jgi:hypothetical protein